MPSLGADMDAGTLVKWHVNPGDTVKRGDVVVDVETDKGTVEVEIWEPGVVESLVVLPGTKVPVGTVLATLRDSEARPPMAPAPVKAPLAPPAPSLVPTAEVRAPSTTVGSPRTLASPAARQLARELGVDIARVRGTGPHGSVTHADVEGAANPGLAPPVELPSPGRADAHPAPRPTGDVSAMRRAIAAAMTRSKREIPHYYLSADVDAQAVTRWLAGENAHRGVGERILLATMLLKATALAVREVPEVNGFFLDGELRISKAVHVGVAVSLRGGGLIAPAIHDADAKPVGELQLGLRDLVARARSGRLRSSEMADPTLTVTNLGDQGVLSVFGVIYPPQVSLVGFGKVTERPWAEGGMIGARPVVTATLAADHRASDGHRGALFLAAIGRLLQEPEKL